MNVQPDSIGDALQRLRRIEGQIAGIARMVEGGRDCRDIVTQISAASKALDQVGFRIVASGLRSCLGQDGEADATAEFEKLFLKLA